MRTEWTPEQVAPSIEEVEYLGVMREIVRRVSDVNTYVDGALADRRDALEAILSPERIDILKEQAWR